MPRPTPLALNTLWSWAAGEFIPILIFYDIFNVRVCPSRLYEKLILLVTKCEVYSVRATCFSALGLVAGTEAGANLLFKLSELCCLIYI